MAGIRIVTDSASDLPKELLGPNGITVVPLDVRLGDADPAKLRDLSGEEFWRLARETDAVAETAAPSPGAFAAAFREAHDGGAEGVVCITISSDLSATFQAARAGAAEVEGEIAVKVIDSRAATMGEGLLVLYASELASGGAALEEVAREVNAAIDKVSTFGTLDTLDALRRGGRIGGAQAFIGSLLSIKPVVEVRGGVVEGESKQRTRARSLQYLVEKVRAAGPLAALAVVHAAAEDLGGFLGALGALYPSEQTIVTYIGPVIGAHTGLGTVGVCFRRA